MHVIKRQRLEDLRFGALKGRKTLIVWDRAGIDFRYWEKAKGSGVYFVSREKDNMRLEVLGRTPVDYSDYCNQGVLRDELVATSTGVGVRRIIYYDEVGEVEYSYLTSNLRLPPGLIVLLYKQRWDIEKTFDETENRFEEGKAWATTATAKCIQAQLICLAYNLCLLMEELLQRTEQISNLPELRRRAQRQARVDARLAERNCQPSFIHTAIDRLTQRGAKLIRWIRNHLYHDRLWREAIQMLRRAYGIHGPTRKDHDPLPFN